MRKRDKKVLFVSAVLMILIFVYFMVVLPKNYGNGQTESSTLEVVTESNTEAKTEASALEVVTESKTEATTEDATEEYTFKNNYRLEDHFEKHGKEMGFKDAESYEVAASDVVNNPEALHKTEKEDGDDVYYVEKTNEFVVVSPDGYIRTYFNPDDGINYYNRQ